MNSRCHATGSIFKPFDKPHQQVKTHTYSMNCRSMKLLKVFKAQTASKLIHTTGMQKIVSIQRFSVSIIN